MTTCWIGIASAEHVRMGLAGGFAMFSHGRHDAAGKVRPGDWVAYYSPRERMKEGAEIRAFTAIGQALEGEPRERVMAPGMTGWYRPMRWLDGNSADVYPLLDRFSFIADRRHWGMYFRKSLFRVPAEDFALIAEAMGVELT